jgi:hypothetical protein
MQKKVQPRGVLNFGRAEGVEQQGKKAGHSIIGQRSMKKAAETFKEGSLHAEVVAAKTEKLHNVFSGLNDQNRPNQSGRARQQIGRNIVCKKQFAIVKEPVAEIEQLNRCCKTFGIETIQIKQKSQKRMAGVKIERRKPLENFAEHVPPMPRDTVEKT